MRAHLPDPFVLAAGAQLTSARAAFALALALACCMLALPRAAEAEWKTLGTRWAMETDAAGAVTSIVDLSYGGLLGRIAFGHVNPRGPGLAREALVEGWWRQVPWKAAAGVRMAGSGQGAPRSFALADIDWDRASRDPRRFGAIVGRWNRNFAPAMFESIRFERAADGGYDLVWQPSAPGMAAPLRVVDLKSISRNLWRTLGRQLLEFGIGEAADLIAIPVVQALLGTALDRFFHAYDLLRDTRNEALGEVLEDAPPGFELDAPTRERAGMALLYAETPILLSFEWLWQRPARQWADRQRLELATAADARGWLARHAVASRPLSAFFDEEAGGQLDLSGGPAPWLATRAEPETGFDPAAPHAIFDRRVAIDLAVAGVDFVTDWLPWWAGGVIFDAYKLAVEVPEDARRKWEARLGARLEDRQSRLGESWEPVLERLTWQQENGFELSRSDARKLIALRRAEIASQSSIDDRTQAHVNPQQQQ